MSRRGGGRAGASRPAPPRPAGRKRGRWTRILLAVILVFFVAVRLRLLAMPLERDEGEYAYAGQLLLQGIPPYQLAYNMKWPGIYFAYALVMALFGQSTIGIHLGLLLVNAAAIALMFLLARELFDAPAGLAAAAAYGMLTIGPGILGSQAHATHFVVVPALAGLLLLLRATATRRLPALAASGLLLGLALIVKQQAVFLPVFALLHLAWSEWRVEPRRPLALVTRVGLFAVCLLIPLLATCAYLAATHVFDRFWFWTIQYARAYVSEVPARLAFANFAATTRALAAPNALLWVLAALGLVLLWRDRIARGRAGFVTGFLLAAFLTVCPGFYFRQHYYVTWMPAVALLAGVFVSAGSRMLRGAVWVPATFLVIAMLQSVATQAGFFFTMPLREASLAMYGNNPWTESVEIARYIRERTRPDDTIAVLGSEPQIYFHSGRRSATGYIYVYGLMEPQPYAHRMQLEMIREIEKARPRYIVCSFIATSWMRRDQSDPTLLSWQGRYCAANYRLAGFVQSHLDGPSLADYHTDYVWDAAVATRVPDPKFQTLYVYVRK